MIMCEVITGQFVKKEWENISHYYLDMYGHRVSEKVYSILEFKDKWWPWSDVVLSILDRQDTLQIH